MLDNPPPINDENLATGRLSHEDKNSARTEACHWLGVSPRVL